MSADPDRIDGVSTETIVEYIERHPDATTTIVLGRFLIDPEQYDAVAAMTDPPRPDRDEDETVAEGRDEDQGSDEGIDTVPEEPTTDDEDGLTAATIREHYTRVRPVYETLADMAEHPTIAKFGRNRVYTHRDNDDPESLTEWPRVGRPVTFERDLDELIDGAATGGDDSYGDRVNRTIYAHTSYNDPDTVYIAHRNKPGDSIEWDTDRENPMPKHESTHSIAAWGDIDLADGVKPRRPDLTEDEQATVEAAIEAYIEEYASLYGSRDAVYALDSVGGLYIMGAPEATLPVIAALRDDPDGRERFISEFITRSNDYLKDAEQRVNDRVDGTAELLDPDWCNNINRAYKAPLSIHKDHDAVVTPIDTDAPRYEFTSIETVDDELIDGATEWAREYTNTAHDTCVVSLIETLWPEEYEETDSWIGAIRLWLEDEREREQQEREERRNAITHENNRLDDHDIPDGSRALTTSINDVFNAVSSVPVEPLLDRYAESWSDRDGHFTPGTRHLWRDSNSGTSCFVGDDGTSVVDTGPAGGRRSAEYLVALAEGIITDLDDELSGADYWKAVDALRDEGYDIPEFVPEAGGDDGDGGVYEKTPYFRLKRAAVATGVLPPDAFVERESDDGGTYDGGTYDGFPGAETFNRTLAELEDRGIDHGWDYAGDDAGKERATSKPTRAEVDRRVEEQYGDDEEIAELARIIDHARLDAADQ